VQGAEDGPGDGGDGVGVATQVDGRQEGGRDVAAAGGQQAPGEPHRLGTEVHPGVAADGEGVVQRLHRRPGVGGRPPDRQPTAELAGGPAVVRHVPQRLVEHGPELRRGADHSGGETRRHRLAGEDPLAVVADEAVDARQAGRCGGIAGGEDAVGRDAHGEPVAPGVVVAPRVGGPQPAAERVDGGHLAEAGPLEAARLGNDVLQPGIGDGVARELAAQVEEHPGGEEGVLGVVADGRRRIEEALDPAPARADGGGREALAGLAEGVAHGQPHEAPPGGVVHVSGGSCGCLRSRAAAPPVRP
jgi:hypothetical protein